MGERCTEERLAAHRAPPGGNWKTMALEERWCLAVRGYRQAVWAIFPGGVWAVPGGNVVVLWLF